jgi:hypothetical protein
VAKVVLLDGRFSSMPWVVAEGRRVLANIERTAKLFVTKTVYAMLLSLAVGVIGWPFPFLPRQLTVIGTLTIGIPAFVMTLEPSARRARPGFVRRGAAVRRARGRHGGRRDVRRLRVGVRDARPPAATRREPPPPWRCSPSAWPSCSSWPGRSRGCRALMIVAMIGVFALILAVPALRTFYGMDMPPFWIWTSATFIAGAVALVIQLLIPGGLAEGLEDEGDDASRPMPDPAFRPIRPAASEADTSRDTDDASRRLRLLAFGPGGRARTVLRRGRSRGRGPEPRVRPEAGTVRRAGRIVLRVPRGQHLEHATSATSPCTRRATTWLKSMKSSSTKLHPDFGGPYGIPYTDDGLDAREGERRLRLCGRERPRPAIPSARTPPIEGGSDRHAIMVDTDTCTLYELFDAHWNNGHPTAGSGAIWDLQSNALRPNQWTSADARRPAHLSRPAPYDEVLAGSITHAIRFTASPTDGTHVWPARHDASDKPGRTYPPMGARFRIKKAFDAQRLQRAGEGDHTAHEALRPDPGRQRFELVLPGGRGPGVAVLADRGAEEDPGVRLRGQSTRRAEGAARTPVS